MVRRHTGAGIGVNLGAVTYSIIRYKDTNECVRETKNSYQNACQIYV